MDYPEFSTVSLDSAELCMYCESKIRRMIPKTEWIKEDAETDYRNRDTEAAVNRSSLKSV